MLNTKQKVLTITNLVQMIPKKELAGLLKNIGLNVTDLTNSCRVASTILSLISGDPLDFVKSLVISEVKKLG